mgnify:CR=1 FL=1
MLDKNGIEIKTGDETERIYNELLEIEQKAEGKEG